AGIEQPLHRRRRPLRHVVAVDLGAVRRSDAGRVDQVLDEQAPAGQRTRPRVGIRLDPRDQRVVRIEAHDERTATASTSIRNSGSTSALTSTSVLAGRASPKNSWRTGLIRARSSMSVRKVVTLTTSANVAPAAASTSRMFANTCRACAT